MMKKFLLLFIAAAIFSLMIVGCNFQGNTPNNDELKENEQGISAC
jgi:hypothetical protein